MTAHIRTLEGIVASDKMMKTAVVEVIMWRKHSRYLKYIKHTRRLKAENPDNQYKTGDRVRIEETRPLSKEKRWRIAGKI